VSNLVAFQAIYSETNAISSFKQQQQQQQQKLYLYTHLKRLLEAVKKYDNI